jgi:hypothetical protein
VALLDVENDSAEASVQGWLARAGKGDEIEGRTLAQVGVKLGQHRFDRNEFGPHGRRKMACAEVVCRSRLGGLLNYSHREAA